MRYEELKDLLGKWEVAVVPKEAARVRGYGVDAYRRLARQTENVDYDCGFRGGVRRSRDAGGRECCSECAGTFGYWLHEDGRLDEDSLKKMAEYYDVRLGFRREGSGCQLPRELRSPTCLFIHCSDVKMSGEEKELLYRIHYGANWA